MFTILFKPCILEFPKFSVEMRGICENQAIPILKALAIKGVCATCNDGVADSSMQKLLWINARFNHNHSMNSYFVTVEFYYKDCEMHDTSVYNFTKDQYTNVVHECYNIFCNS